MQITLEELTVDGLGPYRNSAVIDLADSQKAVLYAPNGRGKTSTIDIVRWVIQGSTARQSFRSIKREHDRDIINWDCLRQGKGGSGEIIIRVGPLRYRVTRTVDPRGVDKLAVQKSAGDRWTPMVQPEAWLALTLPPERLGFNLITLEHVKEFVDDMRGSAVFEAVKRLLRTPELVEAENVLLTITHQSSRRLEESVRKNRAQTKAVDDLKSLENRVEDVEKKIAKVRTDEANLNGERDEMIRAQASFKNIEQLAEERSRYEQARDETRKEFDRKRLELAADFTESWRTMLCEAARPKLRESIVEHDSQRALHDTWQENRGKVEQLRTVLADELCVCTRPVDEKLREHIQGLIDAIESQRPDIPELPAREFQVRAWVENRDFGKRQVKSVLRYRDQFIERLKASGQIDSRLDEIASMLGADQEEEVRLLQSRIRDADEKLKRLSNSEQMLLESKLKITQERDTARKRIQTAGGDTGKEHALHTLASGYAQVFAQVLEESLPAYRSRLEEQTHTYFQAMFTKERGYVIQLKGNGMVPHVIRKEGGRESVVTLSEGEQTRLGMALLFALRDVASEKPFLLLDAPFSTLDDEGRIRLVDLIAKHDGQVVIFTKDTFNDRRTFDTVESMDPRVFRLEWTASSPDGRLGFTEVFPGTMDDLRAEDSQ